MKKVFAAVLLSLAAVSAVHAENKNVNIVCGSRAVAVQTNDNIPVAIVIDNVDYRVSPTVTRKVIKGQLVTFVQAGNAQSGWVATIMGDEKGNVQASLYSNKREWLAQCRDSAY
ncbi:UNVERIFIED_CONTAM: hypothetical protein RF648_20545 [Kocuria sp. CPCC 205274]